MSIVPQEIKDHALYSDIPALLWLFRRYHMASEWKFVARCNMRSSGPASYQYDRIWTPTKEGWILYRHGQKQEKNTER